jgi:hypothetical protein
VLCAACDQHFYCAVERSWIKAHDIAFDHEHIIAPIVMYALTTQSHTLSVTQYDMHAHNTAAIFLGIPSIWCGFIALINPVTAVLGGATLALATVGYNAHKNYLKKQRDEKDLCMVSIPDAIVFGERFYYEHRKSELEKIKQELMTIKNDLKIIKELSSSDCTHQLLQRHTYEKISSAQPLSVDQEKRLSDEQKNRLRQIRDNELTSLENQICDIQFLLALHVNQLIDNLRYAQASYDNAVPKIKAARDAWNTNLNTMTYAIALRTYKGDLLYKHLIHAISQACDELLVVGEYYRVCTNQCIKNSTTIVSALDEIVPTAHEAKKWIFEQEEFSHNNIAIIEKHFAQRNISAASFYNEVKKEFDKQQKERNAQVLKKVAIEQAAHSGFGG